MPAGPGALLSSTHKARRQATPPQKEPTAACPIEYVSTRRSAPVGYFSVWLAAPRIEANNVPITPHPSPHPTHTYVDAHMQARLGCPGAPGGTCVHLEGRGTERPPRSPGVPPRAPHAPADSKGTHILTGSNTVQARNQRATTWISTPPHPTPCLLPAPCDAGASRGARAPHRVTDMVGCGCARRPPPPSPSFGHRGPTKCLWIAGARQQAELRPAVCYI